MHELRFFFLLLQINFYRSMDLVTVKDKQFAISLSEERIRQRVAETAAQISQDLEIGRASCRERVLCRV